MENKASKILSTLALAAIIGAFAFNSPAEGVTVSTNAQISRLQKQVAQLQDQINVINSRTPIEFQTANIAYYTLSNGCREPGTAIVAIPIGATILCGMEVLVPNN